MYLPSKNDRLTTILPAGALKAKNQQDRLRELPMVLFMSFLVVKFGKTTSADQNKRHLMNWRIAAIQHSV